ncbi:MAG: hypothetical protein KJ622_07350, partial [Alphaproteobacteria bacterium]|nr:hypothetical protein [Alphaproteobacteria bacterium]
LAVPITQGPQRTTIDTQTGTSKSSTGYHPGQQRRHGATRHAWRTKKRAVREEQPKSREETPDVSGHDG